MMLLHIHCVLHTRTELNQRLYFPERPISGLVCLWVVDAPERCGSILLIISFGGIVSWLKMILGLELAVKEK